MNDSRNYSFTLLLVSFTVAGNGQKLLSQYVKELFLSMRNGLMAQLLNVWNCDVTGLNLRGSLKLLHLKSSLLFQCCFLIEPLRN